MELLSPAGSFDALDAAVKSGADAVYFGGSLFNARINAQNFDDEAMVRAIDYCRLHDVRSFVTLNTLIHDRDLFSVLEFAAFLYENGVDAVIVQDLGLFSLLKKYIPGLEIHASTQMCISTLEGVKMCSELGFARVVLSRELSIADIKYIHDNSNMPLEVFVHGAMCMSFSGGCLFSSMVGGRSGNCGSCAQPCRKYAAIDHIPSKNELALSLSDLCMIDHISELKNAGAISLKIEGRMKKPEYIAAVTHAYRRAIDGASQTEIDALKSEMSQTFNRGKFSTGYYFGDGGSCNRIGNSSVTKELNDTINARLQSVKEIPVDLDLQAIAGETAKLTAKAKGTLAVVYGETVSEAKKPVTGETAERYKAQLAKLGGSSFEAGRIDVIANGFLPVSSINDLRRQAVLALENALALRRENVQLPRKQDITFPWTETYIADKHNAMSGSAQTNGIEAGTYSCGKTGKLNTETKPYSMQREEKRIKSIVRVMSYEQAIAAIESEADEIVLEYGEFDNDQIKKIKYSKGKVLLHLALPISLIRRASYERLLNTIDVCDFDGIEINNPGQLDYAQQFEHKTGGLHLNVFNAASARFWLERGLERVTLSPELNTAQVCEILKLIPHEKLAVHGYGRVVLMNLYHCPVKEQMGCAKCKKIWHTLFDEQGRAFPVKGMSQSGACDVVRLYNCYPHDVLAVILKAPLYMPQNICLSFTDESGSVLCERVRALHNKSAAPLPDTTRGYFKK